MPELIIELSSQSMTDVQDAIDKRHNFSIAGGSATILDSDGEQVFLRQIKFEFFEGVSSQVTESRLTAKR